MTSYKHNPCQRTPGHEGPHLAGTCWQWSDAPVDEPVYGAAAKRLGERLRESLSHPAIVPSSEAPRCAAMRPGFSAAHPTCIRGTNHDGYCRNALGVFW
ncbi:hypothetical protein [Streptomyces sp. NPDC002758]